MSLGLRAEPAKHLDVLTQREREVLALVGQGLSNDEIAAQLVLSPLTAKTHVSRIMSKVAARDRVHLVVLAYESGLVSPGAGCANSRSSSSASTRSDSQRGIRRGGCRSWIDVISTSDVDS